MKGRTTAMVSTPIALPMPGQSQLPEAGKGWATLPAAALEGVPAGTKGLSARNRTALQRPPRWRRNLAGQGHPQGSLEFGVKKP